jgi:bacitracin transport system permease protein
MLLISFLGALVTPSMMIAAAVKMHYSDPDAVITLFRLYDDSLLYIMCLFGTIVHAVVAAYLFSREYSEKTLKVILTVPVTRSAFIISKFIMLFLWIMALTLVSWAGIYALAAAFHAIFGLSEFSAAVAAEFFGKMAAAGVLMFLTISPFAFLALWSKGLVVPIISAAAVAMGNVMLTNEDLGALYPWASSYFLIKGEISSTGYPYPLVISLIAIVSIFGFIASGYYFSKEDIQ